MITFPAAMVPATVFAAVGLALYVAHHVGDYWVQTDHQASHKGDPDRKGTGRGACLRHVLTYVWTQWLFLGGMALVTGLALPFWGTLAALGVSGVTHYWVDRRWTLKALADLIPGKANFYRLGIPRPGVHLEVWADCPTCEGSGAAPDSSTVGRCWDCRGGGKLPTGGSLGDLPTLGTGAWALDQSFHLVFSVFVPALIIAWSM